MYYVTHYYNILPYTLLYMTHVGLDTKFIKIPLIPLVSEHQRHLDYVILPGITVQKSSYAGTFRARTEALPVLLPVALGFTSAWDMRRRVRRVLGGLPSLLYVAK